MCGIVGYVSSRDLICQNLLQSLVKLEYRGYDSVGFSFIDKSQNNKINTIKASGRITNFLQTLEFNNYKSNVAIAHTRWATHGVASDVNSHPHSNEVASVVHNGIIENYLEIKQRLEKSFEFKSQTDTETILALISSFAKDTSLNQIAQFLFNELKGAFAIAAIFKDYKDIILGLKNKSPLIIGLGDGENYLSSDVYAIADKTNKFIFLEDGQFVILGRDSFEIFDKNGKQITNPIIETINIENTQNSKNGYDSYMLKEINEQSSVIAQNLKQHLDSNYNINFHHVNFNLGQFKKVSIIACGTSFYAGFLLKYYCESIAKTTADCEIASEFRYRNIVFEDSTLYIFLSQSGETADTLAALDFVNKNKLTNSKTLSIVNVKLSSIAKASDGFIECFSGPEIGVASTKNFTTQAVSCLLLALKIAKDKSIPFSNSILESLNSLSGRFYTFLNDKTNIDFLKYHSARISKSPKVMFVARSFLYPIALEGALKLKELAYIPTEGIASGELKHGPIALVDENLISICLLSKYILQNKSESSVQEILARNGDYIVIADYSPDVQSGIVSKNVLNIQTITQGLDSFVLPLAYIPAIQLISCYTATIMKLDVDKPRNLAKSVTVE